MKISHSLRLGALLFVPVLACLAACGGGGGGGSGGGSSSSSSSVAPPAYSPAGADFVIQTQETNQWAHGNPITLTNGTVLVTTFHNAGTQWNIDGQFYTQDGVKTGSSFPITTYGYQPELAPLANGGFVVMYAEPGNGRTFAQIFTAAGTPAGSPIQIETYANYDDWVALTSLAGGGFVITWIDIATPGDATYGITAQIYDPAGAKVGSRFRVNTRTAGDQGVPRASALANGGFVVTWCDNCNSSSSTASDVNAQIFSATGATVGEQITVSTNGALLNTHNRITGTKDGGFAIAWEEITDVWTVRMAAKVKVQFFQSSGSRSGNPVSVTDLPGSQSYAELAPLTNGDVAIAYLDGVWDGWGPRIRALRTQVVSPAGAARITTPFEVNTPTANFVFNATIAPLANGGFALAWRDAPSTVPPMATESTRLRFYKPGA